MTEFFYKSLITHASYTFRHVWMKIRLPRNVLSWHWWAVNVYLNPYLNSTLDCGDDQRHAPTCLPSGHIWMVPEKFAPVGGQTADRPVRSKLLYKLRPSVCQMEINDQIKLILRNYWICNKYYMKVCSCWYLTWEAKQYFEVVQNLYLC